jgi:hypothetical protein
VRSPALPPPSIAIPLLTPPRAHAASDYDGWIISYDYVGSLKNAGQTVSISSDVVVPLEPTKTSKDQDVAFFNSFETTAGTDGDILQPVLDFGSYGSNWAIESEHCCLDDNDMQSDPINVDVGDLIRGSVVGTNCDQNAVCQSWGIKTEDLTSGETASLNTTAPMGAVEEINSAVLETYGVSSCDMLPANGQITYFNHSVKNAMGVPLQLAYELVKDKPMTAEFPVDCGFRGEQSGDAYTLIFSKNPTGVGGAGSAGAGGSAGTAGASNGTPGTSSGGTGGTSSAGAGGTAQAGNQSGAGGASGSVGASGGNGGTTATAGTAGDAAGMSGAIGHDSQAGALNVGGAPGTAAGAANSGSANAALTPSEAASGSCSCRIRPQKSGFGQSVLASLFALVGLLGLRRRYARVKPPAA